jgi:GAF domain-containing protein
MPCAPLPPDEAARLALLESYAILDTPPESAFDSIVARAAALFATPMAALSLVDRDRFWFKARLGIAVRDLPRSAAFCAYAILGDDVLTVEDAAADARFDDNPFVYGEAGIRFYAGAPLISPGKGRLGSLCVLDRAPRPATPAQATALAQLAREAMARLEVRRVLEDATGLFLAPRAR